MKLKIAIFFELIFLLGALAAFIVPAPFLHYERGWFKPAMNNSFRNEEPYKINIAVLTEVKSFTRQKGF